LKLIELEADQKEYVNYIADSLYFILNDYD